MASRPQNHGWGKQKEQEEGQQEELSEERLPPSLPSHQTAPFAPPPCPEFLKEEELMREAEVVEPMDAEAEAKTKESLQCSTTHVDQSRTAQDPEKVPARRAEPKEEDHGASESSGKPPPSEEELKKKSSKRIRHCRYHAALTEEE